jgi:hypothetical protein
LYLRFARLHEELDFEQAALTFARDYGLPDGATIVSPFTGMKRHFRTEWSSLDFLTNRGKRGSYSHCTSLF